jgi:hypothetical protein
MNETHGILRQGHEQVIVKCHGIHHVLKSKLFLSQPEPGDRILSPKAGQFNKKLMGLRWSACCRRLLLFNVLHEGEEDARGEVTAIKAFELLGG